MTMRSLFRLLRRLWQPRDEARHGQDPPATRQERDRGDSPAAVRARFWSEVKEGRLEADERIARREQ